jgi:hypothetical protein
LHYLDLKSEELFVICTMEPKKKFWRKNGGGCSFLKLWTKSKLTKQPVVTTCPEYTSMECHTLRILRCMPDVTTIGVHGIGGIGKTSVLKAVIDFPPIKLLFDGYLGECVKELEHEKDSRSSVTTIIIVNITRLGN